MLFHMKKKLLQGRLLLTKETRMSENVVSRKRKCCFSLHSLVSLSSDTVLSTYAHPNPTASSCKSALFSTQYYRHMTCPLHTTHNSSVQKRHYELSEHSSVCLLFTLGNHSYIDCLCWATPGGTAIPGRPVARAEQAPGISPVSKNQFNIVVARKPRIRY